MEVLSGSYATVETLVGANPETGVYIIISNGHAYSWTKDAECAIDLGVYQSTGIADNSVKSNMIYSGVNILDGIVFEKNKNVSDEGNIFNSQYGDLSDFIRLRNDNGDLIYKKIYFSSVPSRTNFRFYYDKNKNFVIAKGVENISTLNEKPYTIYNYELDLSNLSESVYYFRVERYYSTNADMQISDTPFILLNYLQIDNNNFKTNFIMDKLYLPKDILFNKYLSRPDSGEIHFTVEIERKINNVIDTYSDSCVLFLPPNYKNTGKKTRLVISCHGSGTIINDEFHINSKSWNKFLYDMGYAILDVNGGVPDGRHYGAPFAIQSYLKAYNYVIENYNLYKEVFVLGASMGGLSSFSLVNSNNIPVIAQGAYCPVIDHFKSAWGYPWYSESNDYSVQRKAIANYFNFDGINDFNNWNTKTRTSNTQENDFYLNNIKKTLGFNPIINNSNYKSINLYSNVTSDNTNYNLLNIFRKVPLKIWYADKDNTVLPKYSQYLINAINNTGNFCQLHSYDSSTHTPGWGEKSSVTSKYNVTATGFNNEVETYKFFKQFE